MRKSIVAVLGIQIAICAAQAQTTQSSPPGQGQAAPAAGRDRGRGAAARPQGPLVLPDRRVTFRLYAPKASEVILSSELWKRTGYTEQMKKDDTGMWTLTVGPLTPGFYDYYFIVDGLSIPDPGNGHIKPGRVATQSELDVPGTEADWEALRNVPHGDVRVVLYYSESLKAVRRMQVYLPPGYETGRNRYPVLYLFHGGGDTDEGWVAIGRANLILDNLLAEKKAKPMIVVMPHQFTSAGSVDSVAFCKDFAENVMPYTEKNFRTLPGSANRAIGGLGIPAGQGSSVLTDAALQNFDKFNYVFFTSNGSSWDGALAQSKQYQDMMDNPANIKRVKFFVGDGMNNNNFARNKALVDNLKKRGYDAGISVDDGIHGWHEFRRDFYEALQVLFR